MYSGITLASCSKIVSHKNKMVHAQPTEPPIYEREQAPLAVPLPPVPTTFYLLVSEEQALELSFGRVPALVQEMARTMTDWTQEDLRRNAAKPVQLAAIKTRRTGVGTGEAPPKRAAVAREKRADEKYFYSGTRYPGQ